MFKIAKSLFAIVAVATIAAGSTGAYFSDSVTVAGNTFASGTLDITVNGDTSDSLTAVYGRTNLAPGAIIPQNIMTIANVGNLSGHHLNLTVTIDNDNDLAKNINFNPTGSGLRFGASAAGADSENLVEEIIAPALGNDYVITKPDGSAFAGADADGNGTLSLSELAAVGKIRIAADGNNEGIVSGTTAYLYMNASVDSDLTTQGETVTATFTWEIQQDPSQM